MAAGGAWRDIDTARHVKRGPTYHDAPSTARQDASGVYDPNVRVKPGTAPTGTGQPPPGMGPGSAPTPTTNPYGTESGPGILEQWFNMRATGTDPAFDYASKRGMETLGNQYSAAGAYNSGAARQGESDLMANLISQRMGQLDNLAGGASGEHRGRVDSMFAQGLGLAGGRAGLNSIYDTTAANNMNSSFQQQLMMELAKAGVDAKAAQGIIGNLATFYGMSQMGGGGRPYG